MHKLLLLSLFTLLGVIAGQQQAFAQAVVAEQPCDPAVYQQMASRAWLESEREIMQNQNLIFKADSVLEYTCFDQFLSKAAWEGGDIFSHTTYFGPLILDRSPATGLEYALERTVYTPFEAYRTENFQHSLLGGRGHFVGLDNQPGTQIIATSTPQTYNCAVMTEVWAVAKCLNFVENNRFNQTDSFYPFETIVGINGANNVRGYDEIIDTRHYPPGMECNSTGLKQWTPASIEAANRGDALYQFQSPLGEIFLDVFRRTTPGACTAPIMTGVEVVLPGGARHDDGVCSNPGCTFNKSGSCG